MLKKIPRSVDMIDEVVSDALEAGIVQLRAEDEQLDGRTVRIHGRRVLNFSSCSYLGLELDPRLAQGAIEATQRYGTQFSSSRSYVSAPPYEELEALLARIFEAPVLVAQSTTLAHLSSLPVLIEKEDAVVLDHQVHQSVHLAASQLRLQGNTVELVRHGRVERLEQKIRKLSSGHRRVWYLGDGVYSMYGEFAPARALAWLLSRHEQLHLYLDDAHGMSWTGRHGRGYAAEHFGGHERVVIATSLNKSFACAGGALVFPNTALLQRVRNCGSTFMFSGPVQPPMLGAAIASARIHLSPEIERLQRELRERISLANSTAAELDLPLVSSSEVPIRYIGLGTRSSATDMAAHLLEEGIYVNPTAFPAVSAKRAGARFMVTRHHRPEDVEQLLRAMAERLPVSLAAGGMSRGDVDRVFGLEATRRRTTPEVPAVPELSLQHARTIRAIEPAEWDRCLGGRGVFDSSTLALFEEVFGPHQAPENRWNFHYFLVRDGAGRIVLATFFTESLWKDDLLSTVTVSNAVERQRAEDPYFLTSRTLSMGSLLTEGDHLYLDRNADWRAALRLLLAAVEHVREEEEISTIVFRDLPSDDEELSSSLAEVDFLRLPAPDTWVVDVDWGTHDEYLERLSRRARRFHERVVRPAADGWELEVVTGGGDPEVDWDYLHTLYREVQGRHLTINTFPLPMELLPQMVDTRGWEILLLRLRDEEDGNHKAPPRGFAACRFGAGRYDWLLVGMDYDYVESHGLYSQLISRVVKRAKQLGATKVGLGLGSETMKQRFGARCVPRATYVQSLDHFHHDVLALLESDRLMKKGSTHST
jgi:7-keto-8-aminopelargonate synthetase-like enzyme/predicted N-acyltransferase